MLLDAEDSQLILIDFQSRLMPVIHDAAGIVDNAGRLARLAGLMQVPLVVTEENPERLGSTVPELQAHVDRAKGRTLAKMSFSAVADGLGEMLRPKARPAGGNARSLPRHLQKAVPVEAQRSTLVVAGCEAHVCLMQTALDLIDEEFDVWVVTDACGSRTERNRDAAFDRLAAAGAELVTTEMVAFEWVRSADHPAFAEVLACVKAG